MGFRPGSVPPPARQTFQTNAFRSSPVQLDGSPTATRSRRSPRRPRSRGSEMNPGTRSIGRSRYPSNSTMTNSHPTRQIGVRGQPPDQTNRIGKQPQRVPDPQLIRLTTHNTTNRTSHISNRPLITATGWTTKHRSRSQPFPRDDRSRVGNPFLIYPSHRRGTTVRWRRGSAARCPFRALRSSPASSARFDSVATSAQQLSALQASLRPARRQHRFEGSVQPYPAVCVPPARSVGSGYIDRGK